MAVAYLTPAKLIRRAFLSKPDREPAPQRVGGGPCWSLTGLMSNLGPRSVTDRVPGGVVDQAWTPREER